MIQCPLCGYRFRPQEGQSRCKGCIFAKRCGMVCCPNCGYTFPPVGYKRHSTGDEGHE